MHTSRTASRTIATRDRYPNTGAVIRSRKLLLAWTWVLSMAILAVPMGSAHWHLCHDGREPPVSERFTVEAISAPGGVRSTIANVEAPTHDLDISLTDIALAKRLVGIGFLALAPTHLFALPVTVPVPAAARPDYIASVPAVPVFRFRPPMRAPPV